MKKGFKYGLIGLVLLFMYAPILILAVYSFTDAANIGPFRSFSVHNYVTLFTTPELLNMILGSVNFSGGQWFDCNDSWYIGCNWCILF